MTRRPGIASGPAWYARAELHGGRLRRRRPSRRTGPTCPLLVVLAAAGISPVAVRAQEMPLSLDLQVQLLSKVMAFDRRLQPADPDVLRVGLLYQEEFRHSVEVKDELLLHAGSVRGAREVRFVPLRLGDPGQFRDLLDSAEVDVLYLAPVRALDLPRLSAACADVELRLVTGVPDYVSEAAAVGLATTAGRPSILVNLDTARAQGADFDAQLLKLARIVRPGASPEDP